MRPMLIGAAGLIVYGALQAERAFSPTARMFSPYALWPPYPYGCRETSRIVLGGKSVPTPIFHLHFETIAKVDEQLKS